LHKHRYVLEKYDIRNNWNWSGILAGLTYNEPAMKLNMLGRVLLQWCGAALFTHIN